MIPPVKTLILFGAGSLITEFATESIKRGINTNVFPVTRHLEEIIDIGTGLTLKEALEKEKIPFYQVKDINYSSELIVLCVDDQNVAGIGLGEAFTFEGRHVFR